jgi:hypothetical protein
MLDEIAIEWEDRFNRYLADIKDRMQQGLAAAEEAHQLVNLERIVCVYDLMMKRTIERVGSWPAGKGSAAEVDRLIERVQPAADANTAVLRDALENAVLRGHLIAENGHGRIRWRWRDYL